MFFEVLFFALVLIKFDQNHANHVKEITDTTAVRDVGGTRKDWKPANNSIYQKKEILCSQDNSEVKSNVFFQ